MTIEYLEDIETIGKKYHVNLNDVLWFVFSRIVAQPATWNLQVVEILKPTWSFTSEQENTNVTFAIRLIQEPTPWSAIYYLSMRTSVSISVMFVENHLKAILETTCVHMQMIKMKNLLVAIIVEHDLIKEVSWQYIW